MIIKQHEMLQEERNISSMVINFELGIRREGYSRTNIINSGTVIRTWVLFYYHFDSYYEVLPII